MPRPLVALIFCAPIAAAHGEDAALKEEAANSKLQRQIVEDKKAIQDAKYPKPSVTPPTAGIKADSAGLVENHILAYCALRNITAAIADEAKELIEIERLVLLSPNDVTPLLQYHAMVTDLERLKGDYEDLLDEVTGSAQARVQSLEAITVGTSVLGGIAGMLALMQTNTTLTGANFQVDEMALANAMYKSLQAASPDTTFVWSGSLGIGAASGTSLNDSPLVQLIDQVKGLKKTIQSKLPRPAAKPKPDPSVPAAPPDAKVARFAALNASFDALLDAVYKPDAKGQLQLASLAVAARLAAELNDGATGLLALKIVALGGNNMTTQNLFFGSHLYQSGGAIGAYQIFNRDGEMVLANTIPSSSGYVEFDRHDRSSSFNQTGFDKFCPAAK